MSIHCFFCKYQWNLIDFFVQVLSILHELFIKFHAICTSQLRIVKIHLKYVAFLAPALKQLKT